MVVCVVDGEDGGDGVVREVQFGELVGQLRRSVLSVSVVRAVRLVEVIIMSGASGLERDGEIIALGSEQGECDGYFFSREFRGD